ncbi:MAG: nitroreductase family protein [Dehalococcoides mccartyi]|jgi:Nitroreductase|uniref:Nitroreductase n=3 Tax=root TaxID=1 RepID=A0AB33HPH1_9CHLR|nr:MULTISPECIES: nitroreductase family protein [Dehalococcoides]AQU03027.1 nitroreductase family protein [Dehalococcoides mccartyi]AQU04344.1 nitroreductase family protein [Dehalococcoides mccartyi]MEA4879369.1 nitroreductase family protein [Dehalococcoides mccartyi]OBW62080.1 MAG: NADH dehydrogenase [Dehalococcoides mccartyi]WRO07683.1 nitroreductase family protein [Dehalococcoides mccartyi]
MDTLEAIFSRRSTRHYQNGDVSPSELDTLLRAGMAAPSAGNQQVWHFVVIDERRILDKIPDIHPYSKMLKEAPMAIMVCADTSAETKPGYWIQDCAAASQNILLAAEALGLGACWLGLHPREERKEGISQLLNLPANISPLSLIAIGKKGEVKPPAGRYLESHIHKNGWQV